jgi:UDP-N-acetylmuramyl pentapeptide synthase
LIQLSDLLAATDGRLLGDAPPAQRFSGFCFDSRRARPGELFVALRTERGDGHDFVADALARGAAGALVEADRWPGASSPSGLLISVPDTYEALTRYAREAVRWRALPVIAITGSVGKTSTRAALAAVLSRRWRVFQNPANFNGRLGVPIALGGLEPDHELLVLEMGADRFGEIRELCEIAPPRIGIVTTIGEAHLAYFGSQEEIAREKRAVIEALPADGLAILNRDDLRVWDMRRHTQAEIIAVSANDRWPVDGPAHLHPLSRSIAWAVGRSVGLADDAIANALMSLPALPGRLHVLPGINGIVLVDDSFNASPASMRAAIAWLDRYRSTRRFLILGDMDQLGERSAQYHREVGAFLARHADERTTLVTLGEQAYHIAVGAREAGMDARSIVVTYLARDAVAYVRAHARAGDFSSADLDEGYTQLQLARFRDVLSAIGDLPTLRYVHAANSAGALAYPEARFNMVRIGLAMYGLNPFHPAPLRPAGLRLRPAMTWRTTIAQVKTLPVGTPVSYGGRFVCPRETTIAVIPVGYADGFRRAPCTFGEVLVRGQRAPIVGAVCMDQSMIDVSHIPNVRIGDEVVIIGQQGSEQISAEAVAARLGTISYEVISAILPRVPRVS